MKKRRVRGKYAEPLIEALEKAGYLFQRHRHGSHITFVAPERPTVYLPSDIDCKGTANKIARAAGVTLSGLFVATGVSLTACSSDADRQDRMLTNAESATVMIKVAEVGGDKHGSGFLINKDGAIATAYHVASGEDKKIMVILKDGTTFEAKVIGGDKDTDISVLKIDAGHDLPYLKFAAQARLGEKVFEIGYPFGMDFTLTSGIVSAIRPSVEQLPGRSTIQFDAPTNPGNSGGPLINGGGEVVGMAVAIWSPTHTNAGLGFAICAEQVQREATEFLSFGKLLAAKPPAPGAT